jgi:hypothetical protein
MLPVRTSGVVVSLGRDTPACQASLVEMYQARRRAL